jgi:exonuclease III
VPKAREPDAWLLDAERLTTYQVLETTPKAADEAFPQEAIRAAGYAAVWHGQKSWNGVAILIRGSDPVLTRRSLPGDDDDTQCRYIEAALQSMLVGCLYLATATPRPARSSTTSCAGSST